MNLGDLASHRRIFARCAIDIRTAVVVVVLMAVAGVLFWPHIVGQVTFIGDSDRLNSLLNLRMFQVRNLQTLGRIPTWDENMFAGYAVAGLHWMQPNYDPLGRLLAFLSVQDVFRISGLIAALWIVLSGLAGYLYIRLTVDRLFPAIVGSLLYCLSVFSLHRTAQVDSAEMSFVFMPLGLLLIRQVHCANLAVRFLGLVAVMAALAYFGFLQEVSYIFFLFGFYALYRSIAVKPFNPSALVLLSTAAFCSLVIAAPRLITVAQAVGQLERTYVLQKIDFIEILRFFHEGLFGRYMEERQLAGNVLNVHEGVQLLGSTFAALLIVAGLFHPRDRWQSVGSFLVAAVLGAIAIYLVPRYGSALSRIFGRWISLAAAAVLVNAAVIAVFAAKRHINRTLGRLSAAYGLMLRRPRDLDTGFHLIWMGGILAAVTIPEVQHIVYRLYGGLDFTHSRLSIVAVLSASALAAIFLNELLPTQSASDTQPARIAHLAVILIASLFVAWMIKGTALDSFDWTAAIKIGTWSPLNRPIPAELVKTLVAGGIFVALMVLAFASRHQKQTVQAAVFALGCIMAFEAVAYARFKYSGPHTHTYPIPFRANNYFNAPPCTLIPPSATAVRALRQRLEADEYRSVLLADLVRFPAFTEPHIAQFWDLRLLGGYGAGVPSRLTSLPWPKELHRVRNIRFFSLDTTSLKLLALLNVKYIVFVDDALYFNRDSTAAGTTSRSPCTHHDMAPGQVSEVENPYKPIPRQFFARQIVPATFGDAAISPDNHPQDTSIVEGIDRAREFATNGTIHAEYAGDRISIHLDAAGSERFLVLNEMYDPNWQAFADGKELPVLAANVVMRGVVVPAGSTTIEMRYVPFIDTVEGRLISIIGLIGSLLSAWMFAALNTKRRWRQRP